MEVKKINFDKQWFLDKYKNKINRNVKIIGAYNGMNAKVLCRCLICGAEYETTPASLKQGCMHKSCASIITNIAVGNTLDINAVKSRLKNINDTIQIINGNYINQNSKLKCKCEICGEIWEISSKSLLNKKRGCPNCSIARRNKSRTFSHEKFLSIMKNIDESIEFESDYAKSRLPIKCICKKCGNRWKTTPDSLMRGHGCKTCSSKKSHEEFVKQVALKKTTIQIADTYIDCSVKMEFICSVCGNHFKMTPHQFLKDFNYSYGCSKCNSSVGESKIISFLDKNNISYNWQVKYDGLFGIGGGLLSYDFYIPCQNLLIEFQGEQHKIAKDFFGGEAQLEIQKEHDNRKREYAKSHNIELLEIWYYDSENIDEILKNQLLKQSA